MDDEKEVQAISDIYRILGGLDEDTCLRVLTLAISKFGTGSNQQAPSALVTPHQGVSNNSSELSESGFDSFAELYDAFNAANETEQALIAAYWVQKVEGSTSWQSLAPNKLLKDTGYGIENITRALSGSIDRKPKHIVQLKKDGKSKQARKTYKLTSAGIKYVKSRLDDAEEVVE
ncbi:hypothetical protein F4X86_01465 [Candidatus Saccharibacteria bacterium]|nr:hypothetical protein [Candidatus Saccharibacteria bacterium]